ncbi:hypothetical protein DYBT9275_05719 [Dyadobacter sp. CECT 9275]|uniref:Bacillithiol system redox-active protein YtxJ n=1 Tax=Dyadobacter helix TaxID=2822344 RepID=A0A916N8M2_9BACT|nr:bacillithiol system redox-active protein YtxJ [Dyadobacter sp. CECT 9275]CAG5017183.1 hypothetical protein DYBT9275_05719 [Dyadobacter sp. CECT 9275]
MMNWVNITAEKEVEAIKKSENFSIIYKHSPRCMTSLMAYRRLKMEVNAAPDANVPIYIVDVISNRRESMAVAEAFGVPHESPQILLIKSGECIFDTSHEDVSLQEPLSRIVV